MGVYLRLFVLLASILGLSLLTTQSPASAATTYIVNSTNDPGDGTCDAAECTLREAIVEANNDFVADDIVFDIPGSIPHTITVASPFPVISQAVSIDARIGNQPGIELTATGQQYGFDLHAGNSTIRGFSITGFTRAGVRVTGSQAVNNTISENLIGIGPFPYTTFGANFYGIEVDTAGGLSILNNRIGGNTAMGIYAHMSAELANSLIIQNNLVGYDHPNGGGIYVEAQGNVLIGGPTFLERNYVYFNHDFGIFVTGFGATIHGNTVFGNNGDGIRIDGNDMIVGGPGLGNHVSGNFGHGIAMLEGSGNAFQGNIVGVDFSFGLYSPNRESGIWLQRGSNNLVGGPGPDEGNIIGGNNRYGIDLTSPPPSPGPTIIEGNRIGFRTGPFPILTNEEGGIRIATPNVTLRSNAIAENAFAGVIVEEFAGISIRMNSIFDNDTLGIDLLPDNAATGVTANDPLDADDGGNHLQNFPVITSANASAFFYFIEGELDSAPSSEYTLDVYASETCDGSGFGEGEMWIGLTEVKTDALGHASFSFAPAAALGDNEFVTATATAADGSTSEFSACAPIEAATGPDPVGGTVLLPTSPATNHTTIPYALTALIPALAATAWLSRRRIMRR